MVEEGAFELRAAFDLYDLDNKGQLSPAPLWVVGTDVSQKFSAAHCAGLVEIAELKTIFYSLGIMLSRKKIATKC